MTADTRIYGSRGMDDLTRVLRERGEIVVVEREVDPHFELPAVTERVQKTSNAVVEFRRVKGTHFPVVTNLYGSRERLAAILGIAPDSFSRVWNDLTTKVVSPATTTVDGPELTRGKLSDLPLITYSERDAAPYFTSAIFQAKDPESGIGNLSFHRSMFVSEHELRARLAPRHHLTIYHEKAEQMNEPLDAALLIGVPPAVFLAAAAPVPYDVDEMEVAAALGGEVIPVRPCKHVDLMVPAETQIVIEGRFLPNERRPEGPFGEFMGYYLPVMQSAVFEVLDVAWMSGASFHSINCGSAEEVLTLELSVAANIFQRVNAVLPGVVDVTCQPFVNHAIVKIDQQYEGHGRHVLLAALGAEPTWCKVCTVVDADVDIYDLEDVMWAILTRANIEHGVSVFQNIPSFYRDPDRDHWGRLAIDATVPFARRGEFQRKRVPGVAEIDLREYLAGNAGSGGEPLGTSTAPQETE